MKTLVSIALRKVRVIGSCPVTSSKALRAPFACDYLVGHKEGER